MPWEVNLHPKYPLIEASFGGVLTPEELSAALGEILNLADSHQVYHVLADCSGLEGGHTPIDLYGMVDVLIASGLAHKVREALVLPMRPEAIERATFWETACVNRGICVRIFSNRHEAMDWLISELPQAHSFP